MTFIFIMKFIVSQFTFILHPFPWTISSRSRCAGLAWLRTRGKVVFCRFSSAKPPSWSPPARTGKSHPCAGLEIVFYLSKLALAAWACKVIPDPSRWASRCLQPWGHLALWSPPPLLLAACGSGRTKNPAEFPLSISTFCFSSHIVSLLHKNTLGKSLGIISK